RSPAAAGTAREGQSLPLHPAPAARFGAAEPHERRTGRLRAQVPDPRRHARGDDAGRISGPPQIPGVSLPPRHRHAPNVRAAPPDETHLEKERKGSASPAVTTCRGERSDGRRTDEPVLTPIARVLRVTAASPTGRRWRACLGSASFRDDDAPGSSATYG